MNEITKEDYVKFILNKTQIKDIIISTYTEEEISNLLPTAYFIYFITTNNIGTARYAIKTLAVLLGHELNIVKFWENQKEFVRWATYEDRIKWAKAIRNAYIDALKQMKFGDKKEL